MNFVGLPPLWSSGAPLLGESQDEFLNQERKTKTCHFPTAALKAASACIVQRDACACPQTPKDRAPDAKERAKRKEYEKPAPNSEWGGRRVWIPTQDVCRGRDSTRNRGSSKTPLALFGYRQGRYCMDPGDRGGLKLKERRGGPGMKDS